MPTSSPPRPSTETSLWRSGRSGRRGGGRRRRSGGRGGRRCRRRGRRRWRGPLRRRGGLRRARRRGRPGGWGRRGGARRAAGLRRGPRGGQSLLPEDEEDAAGLSAGLSADFFSLVSGFESPLVLAAGALGPFLEL